MIREIMNERRAARGENAIPTGRAGKGQAPRRSERPWFSGMKGKRSASGLIEFRKSEKCIAYVSEKDVRDWEVKSGEKILTA